MKGKFGSDNWSLHTGILLDTSLGTGQMTKEYTSDTITQLSPSGYWQTVLVHYIRQNVNIKHYTTYTQEYRGTILKFKKKGNKEVMFWNFFYLKLTNFGSFGNKSKDIRSRRSDLTEIRFTFSHYRQTYRLPNWGEVEIKFSTNMIKNDHLQKTRRNTSGSTDVCKYRR